MFDNPETMRAVAGYGLVGFSLFLVVRDAMTQTALDRLRKRLEERTEFCNSQAVQIVERDRIIDGLLFARCDNEEVETPRDEMAEFFERIESRGPVRVVGIKALKNSASNFPLEIQALDGGELYHGCAQL